ncbi:hypothetical protein HPB50_029547 [Hyalomma asiaticum]|nr:hypothetical protein HPB50_029547 [Hyalomma asiaticum]
MFGLSDSVNFGSSMRNSQDAAVTAWAGIRPDTACTTPRNPSPRDTNETRRPQDGSAFAADVAESTGNSVPPSESLAGALQNNAQAAPQSARPRVKLDMPSYSGYHDSKSANEGCNYADLEELAAAAKRIQGDILAARAYRPPPSAALSVEPRCAWNDGATAAQARRANASTFADEQVPRGWELSDRALDPYAYALRTAHYSPVRDAPRVRHATERRSYDPPVRGDQRPGRRGFSGRCYQCGATGHIARENRRAVWETDEAAGELRGTPRGDREYHRCVRITSPFSLSCRRCRGLARTFDRVNDSSEEVCADLLLTPDDHESPSLAMPLSEPKLEGSNCGLAERSTEQGVVTSRHKVDSATPFCDDDIARDVVGEELNREGEGNMWLEATLEPPYESEEAVDIEISGQVEADPASDHRERASVAKVGTAEDPVQVCSPVEKARPVPFSANALAKELVHDKSSEQAHHAFDVVGKAVASMPTAAALFSWSGKVIGHCPEEDGEQCRLAVLSMGHASTREKESATEPGSFATVWTKETFGRWIFGIKVRLKTDHDPLTFLARPAPPSASPTC